MTSIYINDITEWTHYGNQLVIHSLAKDKLYSHLPGTQMYSTVTQRTTSPEGIENEKKAYWQSFRWSHLICTP